jgi:hypothetical protein
MSLGNTPLQCLSAVQSLHACCACIVKGGMPSLASPGSCCAQGQESMMVTVMGSVSFQHCTVAASPEPAGLPACCKTSP